MVLSRNKTEIRKNDIYPYKPQFYYIKVGFRGVKLYRYVFVMSLDNVSGTFRGSSFLTVTSVRLSAASGQAK